MTMTGVEAGEWIRALAGMKADGYRFLDYLTAIDRGDQIEVVAHVVDPDTGRHRLVSTRVAASHGSIGSITSLFPGANWHEREAAEMFGIEFIGHPDPSPLLLRARPASAPLLKATVLSARVDTASPGGS